jgi:hypothetical protein
MSDGKSPQPDRDAMLRESEALVVRIFGRAASKLGGPAQLARHLDINLSELRTYLGGHAMPPESILLRVVSVIFEELPQMRGDYTAATWNSLPVAGLRLRGKS